jgi:hypothetical protein
MDAAEGARHARLSLRMAARIATGRIVPSSRQMPAVASTSAKYL